MNDTPDSRPPRSGVAFKAGNTAQAAPRAALDDALDTHRGALQSMFPIPPARPQRKRTARNAAGTAAAVLLAAAVWWADPAYRSQRFDTAIGELREIALADGSRVVLDTGSAAQVSWHLRSRRVELQQGRAHFDVAPSTLRPMTVAAGDARVRVVGTRFDVWRHAAGTRVTVQEGTVAVWHGARAQESILLQAGQQIRLASVLRPDQPLPSGTPADAASLGAWQTGLLVFQNTPLDEALAEIQRYRQAPIRMHGRFGSDTKVSGVFDSRNTDQLLDRLPDVLPLQIVRHPSGEVDVLRR
ncbi:FecR family protein [Thauera linaloolentis]|uniref:Transmembrane sensor n=1 Tax=Thauera linaloolentis (strain DSM 12138 / JCM 21573 / CCUG 41526 / CIP 105981 / IAM 15112 / NBRC 102519 / 47Lol) TaxID=1123367 RepID=N6ZE79_THAL4|nr:FecR domain-containing protein [Thauera linaloolentis]ENO90459.1 transmembrane sensor [Thauera linaloolentis 47Lol = DSM 12138]MCM8566319.1 FecR domain-containing protein [Thauera linaloolentis]